LKQGPAASGGVARPGERKLVLLLVPTAAGVAAALIAVRLHFEPPTVPNYSLAGDSGEVAVEPGASFEMVLRPASAVKGAIGARAFLVRGTEVRPWDAPSSVSLDGSVRIAGPTDALFAGVPGGPWEIAVAVGRPEVLPTAPRDVTRSPDADARPLAFRLVRERIRLTPR
jgi:hypothetical protein